MSAATVTDDSVRAPLASAGGTPTPAAASALGAAQDGTDVVASEQIGAMRNRIDEIDEAIIQLWQERAGLSQQVGSVRVAAGGTRLVLSREREVLDRFRTQLGADGTQLALLILRAGRGRL